MKITYHSIDEYISDIEINRKNDILSLIKIFKTITNEEPKMWGSIIGFGNLHYKYESGLEGDMPLLGLSNRKQAITLYISYTLNKYEELKDLGKFKMGKSCLYINKLQDIDIDVLESILKKAVIDTLIISFVTKMNK